MRGRRLNLALISFALISGCTLKNGGMAQHDASATSSTGDGNDGLGADNGDASQGDGDSRGDETHAGGEGDAGHDAPVDGGDIAPEPGDDGGLALGVVLPARIQAEHYDRYEDSDVGNRGGACRDDDVDLEPTSAPKGGACNVGWTAAGEWLEYDVFARRDETFDIHLSVASQEAGRTGHVEVDGTMVGTFTAPSSGWQAFALRTISSVFFGAGAHVVRVVFDTGSVNFDYLEIGTVDEQSGVPALCTEQPTTPAPGQWQSTRVRYESGELVYARDGERNRIVDFSYAGYHYGERALPNVPVVTTLAPVAGDNTAHIQAALDEVGNRTPDENGLRGAVLLSPGRYVIEGTLRINKSGVVLRGSGRGTSASDTILIGRGDTPHQRTLVVLGSGSGNPWTLGPATNITTQFVEVGSLSFDVQDPSLFEVGQEVMVIHPSPRAWIDAVGGGGTNSDAAWAPGSKDMTWVRRIRGISGNTITLDAPVYNHIDRALVQGRVARVTNRSLVREVGIESLRIEVETAGGEDENHVWDTIGFVGAEDSWARDITTLHFGKAGVFTARSIRITVEDVEALDPVAIRTGSRMYNFNTEAQSQLILFTRCRATNGRHNYISNGVQTSSGIVIHRSFSSGDSDSEGHRHWTQAMLFDNVTSPSGAIKLINRGDYGTSHGWGAVHSVIWNTNGSVQVQKPPTAQNYVISPTANPNTNFPFAGAQGHVERQSGKLFPASLYEAQLCARLRKP